MTPLDSLTALSWTEWQQHRAAVQKVVESLKTNGLGLLAEVARQSDVKHAQLFAAAAEDRQADPAFKGERLQKLIAVLERALAVKDEAEWQRFWAFGFELFDDTIDALAKFEAN